MNKAKQKELLIEMMKDNEEAGLYEVAITAIDVILKHSFPNGKHGHNPKFRMNTPKKDYVLNQELTKIIKVLNVKEDE